MGQAARNLRVPPSVTENMEIFLFRPQRESEPAQAPRHHVWRQVAMGELLPSKWRGAVCREPALDGGALVRLPVLGKDRVSHDLVGDRARQLARLLRSFRREWLLYRRLRALIVRQVTLCACLRLLTLLLLAYIVSSCLSCSFLLTLLLLATHATMEATI